MKPLTFALGIGLAMAVQLSAQTPAPTAQRPLIQQYCTGCHNQRAKAGGLVLEQIDPANVGAHRQEWEKVVRKVRSGMMPPAGAPRPERRVLDEFAGSLEAALDREGASKPNPGTVVLHRLNRAEYGNAIRDLLALDLDVSTMLPADDSSEGFDNIAEALKVSPALMESYVSAAANISRLAVGDPGIGAATVTYRVPTGLSQTDHIEGLPLGTRGGILVKHTFPLDAEYTIRIATRGGGVGIGPQQSDGPEYVELTLDGQRAKLFELRGRGGTEIKLAVKAGPHNIGAAMLPGHNPGLNELWKVYGGGPSVGSVAIVGPSNPAGPGDSPSRREIFTCTPAGAAEELPCARQILSRLALHAFRHPASDTEMDTLLGFYQAGRKEGPFEKGVQRGLARMLSDPQFVFRFEREPENVPAGGVYRISDLDLASRMSFFIWSSIPDDELLQAAVAGKLRDPQVLRAQTLRMLQHPKSSALTTNFAGQWLMLRDVRSATPQTRGFTENIRQAMLKETELFVESIIREDRSIRDFLDADYTFVDEQLARHYGISGVRGSRFRRIALKPDDPRRGLLGQGSLLLVTSVASRTSPVARGKFVLESLLGTAPPLPPPNVPALEDAAGSGEKPATVRAQMELHRKNPVCSACHKIMDPIGFSMENFDLVGRWRTNEGGKPIDATSQLVDGTKLDGVATLRAALLDRFDVVAQTLSQKLLTYGTGRAVSYEDMPTVRAITRDASRDGYRFSSLILGVVRSDPFQMRRKSYN